MTQARTKTTMTESFVEQAKKFGEEMKKAGTNVFHAGLGVVATTEEQARDTFDRMVDKGKDYGSEESRFVSRATREVKELRVLRKSLAIDVERAVDKFRPDDMEPLFPDKPRLQDEDPPT